jgi:hypothetical protein
LRVGGAGIARAMGLARSHSEPRPARYQELSISRLVLANRPWRLVRDLSKVLVAIVGSAGFFVVNSNAWLIANEQGIARLLLVAVVALVGLGAWLVVSHSLWERPGSSDDPALMARLNAATVFTLLLGLLFAYMVLYVVVLAALALVVPGDVMASSLRHDATLGDYATAAWFAASMAIVVGAIGSGLETDDEVRETISRYRPQPYPEIQDHPGAAAHASSSDD